MEDERAAECCEGGEADVQSACLLLRDVDGADVLCWRLMQPGPNMKLDCRGGMLQSCFIEETIVCCEKKRGVDDEAVADGIDELGDAGGCRC